MGKLFVQTARCSWLAVPLFLAACGQVPSEPATDPTVLAPSFGTAGYDSAAGVAVGFGGVYVSGVADGNASTRRYDKLGVLQNNLKSVQAGFSTTRAVATGTDGLVYRVTQHQAPGTGTDTEVRKTAKDFHYGLWAKTIASSGSDVAYGLAVDSSDNIYVVGYTTGSLAGTNKGSLDAFIRKYDASGVELWTRQFGTASSDVAEGVAISSSGYVYVVGSTRGALSGSNQGGTDAFVRKYSPSGATEWTRQFQLLSDGDDDATGVAVRGSSEVYVVGTSDYSASDLDGFVRKYDGVGNVKWTKFIGTADTELVEGVSIDDKGSVYVVGSTNGQLHGASKGSYDAFISQYTAAGTQTAGSQFGTPGSDYAEAVVALTQNEIYVAGDSSGTLAAPSNGGTDAFLRRVAVIDSYVYTKWTQ